MAVSGATASPVNAMARFIPDPGTQQTQGALPTLTARLNKLAQAIGQNIYGISGYRSPAHSVAVGGSSNDPHTRGQAEDIGVGSQLRSSAGQLSESLLERFGLTRPFSGPAEVNHIQLLTKPRATRTSLSGNVPAYVPRDWRSWVSTAASNTGLAPAIVAAQINDESGFQLDVTSSAGAEGPAQFLPSTFKTYGPKHGSPFNKQDSLTAYSNYMGTLLAQYNGNVRDALAAYNAGPGNLAAGYGYADAILAKAGAPRTATAGSPSSYGATRPGGQPATGGSGSGQSDDGAGVNQLFTDYEAEVTLPRTAPQSTFTAPGTAGWSAPFQWWWQSYTGAYAQEQSGGNQG